MLHCDRAPAAPTQLLGQPQNMLYSGQLEPGPEAIGPIAPRTALNDAGAMNASARLAYALAGLDL